jgi:PPOX class probable F420-dependent enzyme
MRISAELRDYLVGQPRVARVATVRKAGTPWLQPVWFALDGDEPILVVSSGTVLGRTLRRDPHLALCVDDTEPYGFAILEGRVEIAADPAGARTWTRKMVEHYLPEVEAIEDYLDSLLSDPPLVCRMTVSRICFRPRLDLV